MDAKSGIIAVVLLAAVMMTLCILLYFPAVGEEQTLAIGSKGNRVLEVKARLQKLGYMEQGTITKKYNEKTAAAVMEFQRLKANEQVQIEWTAKRELSKINYHIHTDAIKNNLIPEKVTTAQSNIIYAEEADVLNVAMLVNRV